MESICTICNSNPCTCTCVTCGCYPCGCGIPMDMQDVVNANPYSSTVCDRNTSNNIWFQSDQPGFPGRCKLDLLTYSQVHRVLQRVPRAKRDLLNITTNQNLIRLANTTPIIIPPQEDNLKAQRSILKNSLPYYTVLKGNTDGTPGNS